MERESRGSEVMNAVPKIPETQLDETPVETRIAKLESDVEHIKVGVQSLEAKSVAANDAIAALGSQVAVLSATMATKADVSRIEETLAHVATKADLTRLEGQTKADLAGLEGQMKAGLTRLEEQTKAGLARLEENQSHLATKLEVSKLEGEMKAGFGRLEERIEARAKATESTMIKWFLTTAIALVALVLGIPKLFSGSIDAATTAAHPPAPGGLGTRPVPAGN
jgi:hypothetical protein